MARPLSEQKRKALLSAAADLIAAVGTSASTAKIAQSAGVSEGTLFTYFPSKDDLLNQLFVDVETSLSETMLAPFPKRGKKRDQLYQIWYRLIDWGIQHPVERKVMHQLKASDRISEQSRRHCEDMLRDARQMVEHCLTGYAAADRIGFYIDRVLFGLANVTVDGIDARPGDRDAITQAGFDLFWKGAAA